MQNDSRFEMRLWKSIAALYKDIHRHSLKNLVWNESLFLAGSLYCFPEVRFCCFPAVMSLLLAGCNEWRRVKSLIDRLLVFLRNPVEIEQTNCAIFVVDEDEVSAFRQPFVAHPARGP